MRCSSRILLVWILFSPQALGFTCGFSAPDSRDFKSDNGKFLVKIVTVKDSGGAPVREKSKATFFELAKGEKKQIASWELTHYPVCVLVTNDGQHIVTVDEPIFALQHALVVYDREGNVKLDCSIDQLIPKNEQKQTVAMPPPMELDRKSCKITNDQFTARTERGRVIEVDLKTYKVRTYLENKLSDALWIIAVVIGGTVALLALVWAAMKFLSRFLPAEPVP